MKVLTKYKCKGCGCQWSKDFRTDFKTAAVLMNANRTILVPADKAPCCSGDDGEGEREFQMLLIEGNE